MRFRNVFMIIGSILAIFVWIFTDPDLHYIDALPFGGGAVATIVILFKSVLYIGALHVSRKALLDYIDLEAIITKAVETPEGAGMVVKAVAIIMLAIAIVIFSATH